MATGNPNHEVSQFMQGQWHKMCAVLMNKQGITSIDIMPEDLDALVNSGHMNIVCNAKADRIQLILVSDEEAERLARKAGGLPT